MSENSRVWSASQLKYMAWSALPSSERKPTTEAEIAAEIGVDDRTLRRWKQLPGFWDGVKNEARANLKGSIGRIYNALIKEAETGSFQHIKLALEMLGEHTDKIQHVTWKDEVVKLIQSGMVDYASVEQEFGQELATEFFAIANVEH